MRVRLLAYIPSRELLDRVGEISDVELLSHLAYVFAVEGISRVCSHQLVRHRVASYSQQSQRYVEVERLGKYVVVPKTIEERGREIFDALMEEASRAYKRLIELGVPREDARFVLPNATETHMMVTMDGRSLLHFFGLRCCLRAQWEIRELADKMLREVRRVEPQLFRRAGPYCYQLGYCPEGRFTCGRMEEVKRHYSSLSYMRLTTMGQAEYKVPGGKLIRVRVEAEENRIRDIKITGDFFLHPETDLEELERHLIGVEAEAVGDVISKFFEEQGTILIGISPEDFVKVILKALKA